MINGDAEDRKVRRSVGLPASLRTSQPARKQVENIYSTLKS